MAKASLNPQACVVAAVDVAPIQRYLNLKLLFEIELAGREQYMQCALQEDVVATTELLSGPK